MLKKNCWEFKKCGRESQGSNTVELGVCPVSTEKRLDEVHGGKNAGRACWVVANSICDCEIQGSFNQKYGNCMRCDFFLLVRQEEGVNFMPAMVLLNILGEA